MSRTVSLSTKIAICAISFILLLFVVFYWRSFKSLDNDFADTVNKGNAYMEACCYKDAIDCYQKALEKEPGNERVVMAIINAYMLMAETQGDSDEAIVSYLTALAIRPNNRSAYWALADIYERRGEEEMMLDILQRGFADTNDSTMDQKVARIRNEKSIQKNQDAYDAEDARDKKRREERAENMLRPLLELFENQDYENLKRVLSEQNYVDFADEIIGDNIYYIGDKNSYDKYEGIGLAAYENGYYYYGGYVNNERSGHGVWFRANFGAGSSIDSYLFEGQWEKDYPNGNGIGTTNYKSDFVDSNDFIMEVVEGNFTNGLENGSMTLTGTTKGKATRAFEYSIRNGQPEKIEDSDDGGFVFAKTKSGNASLTSDGSVRCVSGFDSYDYGGNSSSEHYDTSEGGSTSVFGRADNPDEQYEDDEDDNYVVNETEVEEYYDVDVNTDSSSNDGTWESSEGSIINDTQTYSDDTQVFAPAN